MRATFLHSPLIIVLHLRPNAVQWSFDSSANIDRQVILVRHSIFIRDNGCLLNLIKYFLMVFPLAANDDSHLAGVAARPPKIIILMTADRLRKIIRSAEEIYCSGFTKVLNEDSAFSLFFRR